MAPPPASQAELTAAALDHAHVWHPFTPMRQWREADPMVVDSAEGFYLIDEQGNRYLDGVSSLWCNVHGHRVPAIDDAIRKQLDKVAHSTMLGLTHEPAAQFAHQLIGRINRHVPDTIDPQDKLNKVFYSDAGATAVEVAFKMAVGYWHHNGRPEKHRFIGLAGAYHGDTTGTMSVGYSELFHKPFVSMVFDVTSFPAPDVLRNDIEMDQRLFSELLSGNDQSLSDGKSIDNNELQWPSEYKAYGSNLGYRCICHLEKILKEQAHEMAAICLEPVMQGAAGMVCQHPGFVVAVARLAKKYDVLLILDEVATGFGRTGEMFAFESEVKLSHSWQDDDVDFRFTGPDILCLAKGITGGYLPLAATVCSDKIEQAFAGELSERKTLYHGHTYTGNPLACAAAIASLERFDQPHGDSPDLITHTKRSAERIADRLNALRGNPGVLDIRQRGLMVGIELGQRDAEGNVEPFNFANPIGKQVCDALRPEGILIRPLGNVVVLMPPPAMPLGLIDELVSKTVAAIQRLS
ncbi:MAG: aminotransferase class III-fold pyridoxal phosphate-dependent enzyme [Planctomycetota bacterium]